MRKNSSIVKFVFYVIGILIVTLGMVDISSYNGGKNYVKAATISFYLWGKINICYNKV